MTLKKSTKNRIWKKTTCEEVAVLVDFGDQITILGIKMDADRCENS